ncbi:MAG: chemotaxis response regulator protein-glutamate methylesterase [Treponema sp.]|nr:chemotaxis response regulator protein-glutamate methylesterase [Treponema sp.]
MDNIEVLVCDDSALMRNLISRIVNETEGLHVAATAMNGQFAVDKIPYIKPDIIILDIEMPMMSGVEFLKARNARGWEIPVIILSSIATKGAAVTMECLELGASDFITKPGGSASADVVTVSDQLVELISSYGGAYARSRGKTPYAPDFFAHQIKLRNAERFVAQKKGEPAVSAKKEVLPSTLWHQAAENKTPAVITPMRESGRIEIIALGISTGGPNALRDVFKNIDANLKQPILVVQHMPPGFTAEFAASLDRICPLTVTEAKDGDIIEDAHVYIAPGNYHIYVEKRLNGSVIRLSQDAPRNGHRPSADYLFESVAKNYQNCALGVIMTGMGRDGAAQLAEMRKQGAWTLGQDEKSAIVYGMPKVAWELGAVQKQVPLENMASAISELAREHAH